MADEPGYSRVSPGVYVNRNGEVKIKLREASDAENSGINLAPDTNEITPNTNLAITAAAWRRLAEAVSDRRSGS
jgi:hypothetical protein